MKDNEMMQKIVDFCAAYKALKEYEIGIIFEDGVTHQLDEESCELGWYIDGAWHALSL